MELIKYAIIECNELLVVMIEDYSEVFDEANVNFQFSYIVGKIEITDKKKKIGDFVASGGSEDKNLSDREIDDEILKINLEHEKGKLFIFNDENLTVGDILQRLI